FDPLTIATVVIFLGCCCSGAPLGIAADVERDQPGVLFRESFDDSQLLQRGWYDGSRFRISGRQPRSGDGCIEYHWEDNALTPSGSSGARRLFEPTETVYVRFYLRLSENWEWSGRPYHPHLM